MKVKTFRIIRFYRNALAVSKQIGSKKHLQNGYIPEIK